MRFLRIWGSIAGAVLLTCILTGTVFAASSAALSVQRELAYSHVSVGRVTSSYLAEVQNGADTQLIPAPSLCTGLGTLVSTTQGQTGRTIVLTDSRLVNPVTACAGAARSLSLPPTAIITTWHLARSAFYLSTSYTGSQSLLSFDIDTAAIPISGLSDAPIALPLLHEPAYDLPTLSIAPPRFGTAQFALALGDGSQVYSQDTIANLERMAALTPVDLTLPANITSTVASAGTPLVATPTDGVAYLTGMLVGTPGKMTLVSASDLEHALSQEGQTHLAGQFSPLWHAALSSYAQGAEMNTGYTTAADRFRQIATRYPAFGAITAWIAAANAHSPTMLGGPIAAASDSVLTKLGRLVPFLIGSAIIIVALAVLFATVLAVQTMMQQRSPSSTATDGPTRPVPAIAFDGEVLIAPDSGKTRPMGSMNPTVPLRIGRRRLNLHAAAVTDAGIRRRHDPNQDNILAMHGARLHNGQVQAFGLFIVADGMGGHQFGREASSHAIKVMIDHILQPLLDGGSLSEEDLLALLKTSVERANQSIHQQNVRRHADSGTTVTAVLVTGDVAHIVNVGDSRTYHLNQGELQQITHDHSVVASLVSAGVIAPDEIYTHPKRNQIFRSLGEKHDIQVDAFQVSLRAGDHIVLCSDGLWEMVRDPRIQEIVKTAPSPAVAAERLVEEANANGGADNISVVIVGMIDEPVTPDSVGVRILASPDSLNVTQS